MKKSLIALAVLGAVAGFAQAQSSVTIYGIVDTGVTFSNKVAKNDVKKGVGGKVSLNSGIIQGSRLGFKGVEDLGGGLKAVFQLESGFKNDTGEQGVSGSLFNRKSVVGLSSNSFGTVLLGRQTDILDDAGAFTSVQDFGTVTNTPHKYDRLEGLRTQNSIRYNSPNFSGFTASAIYGFGEQAGNTTAGQSFGLGGIYSNGPIGAYLAYYQARAGKTPSDVTLPENVAGVPGNFADGDTATKTFSLGGSYQAGPARLYANWSRVRLQPIESALIGTFFADRTKQDVFEIGTDYALTAPLHLLASIQHARVTNASQTDINGNSEKGKLTQVNLGVDYWLSKRTDLYSFLSYQDAKNYRLQRGIWDTTTPDANGKATQTSVSVGIRHKF